MPSTAVNLGGAGLGPPRVSFLPPSPVEPLLSGAALGAAPPPKDAPGCFGAEELELLGMGNGAELEQVDHGVLWMPCSSQGLAFTGDVAQFLCLCLHKEGTGTGIFHGGVAQTPQGCRGWLGALPVPTGWRCRGRPCHLTFPLCKLGGHKRGRWPRSLGAWCATWGGVPLPQGGGV